MERVDSSDLALENETVVRIDVRATPEFYRMVAKDAAEKNLSLGDVLILAFATLKGQPDLGKMTRHRPGPRPGSRRKKHATVP